ncbi:MAG: hypothetical protein CSA76_04165 [Spirochaetales bacterium]|nr:MAG: hypothetical protein CSA76_04165 [Spirochaetales bacterium]
MRFKGEGAPMVRIAKQTDPVKLEELKGKINDQSYIRVAIDRIAIKLTDEIVSRRGEDRHGYST